MTNQWLQHILHQVIKTVARAGVLLAQEYVRPGGRRGSGAKADIDILVWCTHQSRHPEYQTLLLGPRVCGI
jgi:hypothetical protein